MPSKSKNAAAARGSENRLSLPVPCSISSAGAGNVVVAAGEATAGVDGGTRSAIATSAARASGIGSSPPMTSGSKASICRGSSRS